MKKMLMPVAMLGFLFLVACPEETKPVDDAAVVDAGGGSDAAVGHDSAVGTDAAPAGCGDLTMLGACDGTVVQWCQDDAVHNYDCADDSAGCALVDCDDDPENCYGYGCVAATDDACDPVNGVMCSAVNGEGCLNGVCGASTTCDDTTAGTCDGDSSVFCLFGTLSSVDCSGGGADPYTCAVPSDPDTAACVGLEGAQCGVQDGTTFACAAGFSCTNNECVADSVADAGTAEDAS